MVENSTSSPSRFTQITLDCGAPLGLTVASTANTLASNSCRVTSGRVTLRPYGGPAPVGGGGGQLHRRADRVGEQPFRFLSTRTEPGPYADHLDRQVADLETGGAYPPGGLLEQRDAGGAGPLGLRVAVVGAEVAETRRGQQRAAPGVARDVAVGVTGEPVDAVPQQTGQPARPPRGEGVYVGADPDPGNDHDSSSRYSSATPRS